MSFDSSKKNVELHVHLDGAVRADTVFEIAKRRKIEIPYKNISEIVEYIQQEPPYSPGLTYSPMKFFRGFGLVCEVISEKAAMQQVCREFIEDCAKQGNICYVEVRFAPQKLTGKDFDIEECTKVCIDSLQAAAKQHKMEVGSLICLLRNEPDDAMRVYEVAKKFYGKGVVGIDLAGDDSDWAKEGGTHEKIIKVFQQAKKDNIRRTVHAGEGSPVEAVKEAIEKMHAERIGHGYSAAKDEKFMAEAKKAGIHFELCPSSSYMTDSVRVPPCNHPIHKFIETGNSFSLNTDDPLMTGRWLNEELDFCINTMCFSRSVLKQSSYNAAKAAFIHDTKMKEALVKHVQVEDETTATTVVE